MQYISTRGAAPALGFADALLTGLARDGGLYAPATLPLWSADAVRALRGVAYPEAAVRVMTPFVGGDFGAAELRAMTEDAYAGFRHAATAPLVQIESNLFALELFHGPTLAFKDFAMQWLGRAMNAALTERAARATGLGATSGDTGAAAIEAFGGQSQTDVYILYPHGRVSDVQRRQMTTAGKRNVHALAIEGTFDDCQRIVKDLFGDLALRDELRLSGVNSINWARILAQIVYYFVAAVAFGAPDRPVSFSVPTGNFGDVLAGYYAKRMGLPIERLMVATNENDILARAMANGRYEPRGVKTTQSPSMDIQVSSNFERLLFEASDQRPETVRSLMADFATDGSYEIPPPALERIRADFTAERVDEAGCAAEMGRVYRDSGLVVDPHSAVGIAAARRLTALSPATPVVAVATAHPAKFPDAVERATGVRVPLPSHLADLMDREEKIVVLPNDCDVVADYLHQTARGAGVSVQVTTLPSGLAVATDAMPHVKTAAIGVFVAAGSRHESASEHGLSHLLEHMAFKGTRKRSARDIAEAIEDVGGDLNAETGVERTGYFARVMGADIGLALDVIGDILTDSQFEPDELEREKNVIVQEIGAVEDTPDDLVFDLLTAAAWPDQAIGRPILGTREGVGAFNRDAIGGYLRRHYRASGMVVAAAGAVGHQEIVSLAESRLNGLSRAPSAPQSPADYRGGETRLRKRLEQTHVVVGFEGRPIGASDHDAAHVFAAAAGGGMSSRLFQEVREKRGLAYSIYSFHWDYSDTGLFGFYAGSADRDAVEVVAASLDCLAEAAHKLSEAEIRRAKAQMKVSLAATLESPGARAQQLARQMQVHGRPLPVEEMVARVEAVSVEEVRKTAAAMLRSPPTIAAIGAVGRIPGQAKIAEALRGV